MTTPAAAWRTRLRKLDRSARTWLRINRTDLGIAAASFVVGVWAIQQGLKARPGDEFERGLLLTLAGASLAAFAKLLIDAMRRHEVHRQGSYTERAQALQRMMRHLRDVRQVALDAWKAKQRGHHSVNSSNLVEILSPRTAEDRLADALIMLRNNAFDEDVWLGDGGVQAVRDFNAAVLAMDLGANSLEGAFSDALSEHTTRLRERLKASLGI